MKTSKHQKPWPARLGDPERGEPELTPELQAELQSIVRACVDAPGPSEELTRRAAQRAIELVEARPSVASGMSVWLARLRPARFAMALTVIVLVPVGIALASKLSPDGLSRLGDWLTGRHAVHSAELPPPSLAIPTPPVPSVIASLPASEAPTVEPPTGPLIAKAQRVDHQHKPSAALTTRPSPPPTEDLLASEAGVVSKAIALANDNPHGALDVLTRYWSKFPDGALRGEAAVAEVSARLSLGENAEALTRLDGFAENGFRGMKGTAGELRVTRLELMAGAGRCGEALPLLETELSGLKSASRLRGRALLARAACKANTGDAAGNRADLKLYLTELPDGPRAAQVRRALGVGE